jgi:hypothetical protein
VETIGGLGWVETVGIWVGAFLTLAIFSFLYRDNPVYKFAESLFVGVGAGYWLAVLYQNTIRPNLIIELAAHNWWRIGPLILAVTMLLRLAPRISWISRWAIGFMIGTAAGVNIVGFAAGDLVNQIYATIIPLKTPTLAQSLNSIFIVIGVLGVLIYFFFSREHKGVLGTGARIGIWVLMVAFGASFGYTVMGRVSLLIGRIQYLLFQWLPTIPSLWQSIGG